MSSSRKTHQLAAVLIVCIIFSSNILPAVALSEHFNNWLKANGYEEWDYQRTDLENGSFGGKNADDTPIKNIPIIFIHGNSDIGVGHKGWQRGWSFAMQFLFEKGYTESEMYVTTWGPANQEKAQYQYHSRSYLARVRNFIEAVLEYTGAKKVHIIAHSMGVTLSRKAIKGGIANDLMAGGAYNLGPSLANRVDTFIGIAGANWGLSLCVAAVSFPTCGMTNGFFPGAAAGVGLSSFLVDLNYNGAKEAEHVYSIYSTQDNVVKMQGIVWGRQTSQIPNQDGEIKFNEKPWTHLALRDYSGPMIHHLITTHKTSDYLPELIRYIKAERGNEIDTYLAKGNSTALRFEHIYP